MSVTLTVREPEAGAEKLSLWQKLGYGLGDIYGGGSGVIISFYYLVFLIDIVRISPALAGTVILISKFYDAVTDPLEGILADRTRTRMGRRRPYLLAGIPLVFLSFLGLFYPIDLGRELHRFLFVVGSYLFFSTVVSIVMLNYNALQSELTLDYNERTALSSFRIFFSTMSSILCALLPLEIVGAFDDVRTGYIAMGLAFGAFFALPFIATVTASRERKAFQRPPEPFDWRLAFLEPWKMRTFVYTLAMYLLAFVAMDTVSSIVVFFIKNYLLRGGEASFVSGTLLVAQVASLPFYVWLSKRTSKRIGYLVGAAIWMVTMLFSFFIVPGLPSFVVYLFATVVGLGTGGIIIMVYAIFPDIPDIDELKSGQRREGIYSALFTFTRKLSSAFALFLVSNAIALVGYLPPLEQVVDGATKLVEQPQSGSFVLVLRLVFALVPIVLLAVAILFAPCPGPTPQRRTRIGRGPPRGRGPGKVAHRRVAPMYAAKVDYDFPVRSPPPPDYPTRPVPDAYAAEELPIRAAQTHPESGRGTCYANCDAPWLDTGVRFRSVSGDDGLSRLDELSFPIQYHRPAANGGKWTVRLAPRLLSTGKAPQDAYMGSFYSYLDQGQRRQSPLDQTWVVSPEVGYQQAGRYRFQAMLGATPLGGPIHALPIFRLGLGQDNDWALELRQGSVSESLLSAIGQKDPYSGATWGRVVQSGIKAGKTFDLAGAYWLAAEAEYDHYWGENVAGNHRVAGNLSLGRTDDYRDMEFTSGLSLTAFHFQNNQNFHTFGHGGYFSPSVPALQGVLVRPVCQPGLDGLRQRGCPPLPENFRSATGRHECSGAQ